MSKQDDFVGTVVEKLLTYALGRGLESDDMPVVRSITRASAVTGHRWSGIIAGHREQLPFTMRTVPTDAAAPIPRTAAQGAQP